MFGFVTRTCKSPILKSLILTSLFLGKRMGNGIVLARKSAAQQRMVWNILFVHLGDIDIAVLAGGRSETLVIAIVGVLNLRGWFPLVCPKKMEIAVFNCFSLFIKRTHMVQSDTETADTGKQFNRSLFHYSSSSFSSIKGVSKVEKKSFKVTFNPLQSSFSF